MGNERITEDIVRSHFKDDPLYKAIKLEEQKTSVPPIKKCLSEASKKQTHKAGFPDFIISFPALPNDVVIIECKSDSAFHESPGGHPSDPQKYAVDGVLHYVKFLTPEYNVISIAVSGIEKSRLKVSSFYHKKGTYEVITGDTKLLDIYSYMSRFNNEALVENIESGEITRIAIELNETLNDYSIPEYERCTLVGAILLALQNQGFASSYEKEAYVRTKSRSSEEIIPKPDRVAEQIVTAIGKVLQDNNMDDQRTRIIKEEYQKIKSQQISITSKIKRKKDTEEEDNYVLRDIVRQLDKSIIPLMKMGDRGYDILGKFYTEFIRYAGTDKKTGLVLTPPHITDFFCDVARLDSGDVVLDICCGTGSFLIAAMKRMMGKAGNDVTQKESIKKGQLVGIEKRPDMFTYACSNMMMSGDGKSNIFHGDSFSPLNKEKVKKLKPTVAFLNPPYDVGEAGQLEFIENALSLLQKEGRCVAIVQTSCATSKSAEAVNMRERLLDRHTLEAVFSMPSELFHPVGVVTCIMVFRAKSPHPGELKTYFGFFRDDGFVKRRKKGRVNSGSWNDIKESWLLSYRNRTEELGISVLHSVTARDEWCAEAYMEADYEAVTEKDFIKILLEYSTFLFAHEYISRASSDPVKKNANIRLSDREWKTFKVEDVFTVELGRAIHSEQVEEGPLPYITRTASNNGTERFGFHTENNEKNAITLGAEGYVSFYQPRRFITGNKINIMRSSNLNIYNGLFLCQILNVASLGRFNYGYAVVSSRLKLLEVKLPVDSEQELDWQFMEDYIKSLPYSSNLANSPQTEHLPPSGSLL